MSAETKIVPCSKCGKAREVGQRCAPCRAANLAARHQAVKTTPDYIARKKNARKERYDKLKGDPEAWEAFKADHRAYRRKNPAPAKESAPRPRASGERPTASPRAAAAPAQAPRRARENRPKCLVCLNIIREGDRCARHTEETAGA